MFLCFSFKPENSQWYIINNESLPESSLLSTIFPETTNSKHFIIKAVDIQFILGILSLCLCRQITSNWWKAYWSQYGSLKLHQYVWNRFFLQTICGSEESVYTLSSQTCHKFENDICLELDLLCHKLENVFIFWMKCTDWKRKKNDFPGELFA